MFSAKEKQLDKLRKQQLRTDNVWRKAEASKICKHQQLKRKTLEVKSIQNIRETSFRGNKRTDSQYKTTETTRETLQRRGKRHNPEYRQPEAEQDKKKTQTAMQDTNRC